MATKRFRGDATAVAQVRSATITAYDVATTYTVTINGKAVSVLGQGGTATTTATALAAALNASTVPEFAEVTWSSNAAVVTGTADTAGKPFTCTSSVAGGTGTFGAFADTTASAGPNHWDTAANWDASGVPTGADDVIIENTSADILYGIDQNTVTLTSLTIRASYTGKIGLQEVRGTGTTSYYEYREKYLKISATTVTIGDGSGAGSGRIKLNTGANATTLTVLGTGTPAETGLESLLWKGTNAANVLNVNKGVVGVARFAGETATVATLRVGFVANKAGDATVYCGTGVTLTTINQEGGTLTTNSAVTTLNVTDGKATHMAGAMTTLNLYSGTCYYRSSSTLAAANVGDTATLDFSQDMRARTVSACDRYGSGSIKDPFKTVTWTAGIDLNFGTLDSSKLDLGQNLKITPAAVT